MPSAIKGTPFDHHPLGWHRLGAGRRDRKQNGRRRRSAPFFDHPGTTESAVSAGL